MPETRVYSRRPGLVSANLGDEVAVLHLASSSYLGFNATASQVWRLLQTPQTLDQISEAMLLAFEVDAIQCRDEISALLKQLLAADLITESDVAVA